MSDAQQSQPDRGAPTPMIVSLVRDAGDYRAMHAMIEIRCGEERTVHESAGWKEERPIARLLGIAGFVGGGGGSGSAVVPNHLPVVAMRSFVAEGEPAQKAVREMLARALTGNLGGFHPAVHGQVGFHQAAWAFEYLWSAAGAPRVRIHHPEIISGSTAEEHAPSESRYAAEQNTTLAAVRMLEGTLPGGY